MEAPLDPLSILANTGRLRRLARTLVRDEHLAEDLVQDAWVACLRKPPDEPRALPAWLSRVVRNLATSARRRDAARVRRELARAEPELDSSSTGESLDRFETLKAVVEMVAELEDPGRSSVILHFFDGLTLAQVADRQRVSVGAVRLRLKVALERLRARLDRRFGGRASWVLTLAPLLAPTDLAVAEALGASSQAHAAAVIKAMGGALSVSIKKTSLVIAASILVFLGVGGSWLVLRSPANRAPAGGGEPIAALPEKASRGAANAPKDRGASGDAALVQTDPRPSGPIAIEGRVTGDGAGLPGASVRAISIARWEAAGALREESNYEEAFVRVGKALTREAASSPEERSGKEGGFIFRGLAGGSYRLVVTHPERLPNVETIVSVVPGAPARCAIELAAAASMVGDVRDEAGRPVAGAVVEAEAAETARLRGMARDLWRSVAWSDGSMLVASARTESDAAGAFRLGPLAAAPHALRVSHPAFLRAELIAAPGGERLTITLARGAAIVGRVLGANGDPISAQARASRVASSEAHRIFDWSGSDREPAPEGVREAETTSDGRFRIEGLDAGLHEIEITAPRLAVLHREVDVRQGEEDLGDILLEPPLRIAGRVLDPSGKPVEGARVTAAQARRAHHAANTIVPPAPPPVADAKSDAMGRFVLDGLAAGLFQVEAKAEGFAGATAYGIRAGKGSLDLVLEEGYTVHGKVIDAETEEPIPGAEVELSLAGRWNVTTDSAGLFVVRGYPRVQARYGASVRVTHPAYGLYTAHAASVMGRSEISPLEIRLDRSGHEIRGRVLDAAGGPVANAQVWVEPAGRSGAYSMPGDRTATGEDGSFRLPEPSWMRHSSEKPQFVIGAFHLSRAMAWAGPFLGPSSGGAWPEIEVVLGEGVSLEGTVTGSDGGPVPHARVTAGPPSRAGRERRLGGILGTRSCFTDGKGAYRLERLSPGEAEVGVQALGWAPARIAIDLGQGTGRQDFTLDRGAPIRGRVVDAGGEPLEGVEVAAVEGGGDSQEHESAFLSRMDLRGRAGIASARTGVEGRYEFPHLARGSYTVFARASGHEAAEAKGVEAGEDAPDLVLARFSALRGTVLGPDGAPVTAFKVDLIDRAQRAEQEKRGDWRVGSQGEIGFADVDGRFLYDGLRAGEYDVVVIAPGYLAFCGQARLDAGEEAEIEVRLTGGSRLVGVLRDAVTGRPVADAMIVCTRQLSKAELEALNAKKGRIRPPMSPPSASGHTWSGEGGEWTLDGLLEGDYGVWVTHPLYLKGSGRLELGPGATERLDLTLEPSGRLEGVLGGLGGGAPLEPGIEMRYSMEVELLDASREEAKHARANGEWTFPVDRSGRFEAQALRPGTYRISVKSRAYRRGRFEETGPGWGISMPEPVGPEKTRVLGEVEIRPGETARLHAKVPEE